MKKSELKNGMVVQYRNTSYSNYALVVDDLFISLDDFMPLNSYNEDLACKDSKDFDIVAVYEVDNSGCGLLDILNGKYLKILWGRKKQWKPEICETYFRPNIFNECKYNTFYWQNDTCDNRSLKRGFVCKTKEEAIVLADKIIELEKKESKKE